MIDLVAIGLAWHEHTGGSVDGRDESLSEVDRLFDMRLLDQKGANREKGGSLGCRPKAANFNNSSSQANVPETCWTKPYNSRHSPRAPRLRCWKRHKPPPERL